MSEEPTDPIVPPEVDLRDFGYMPLDVVRLRDSDLATIASGEEFKAAVLLWCAAWHQVPAASLPGDDRLLAKYSGAGGRWPKLKTMALRGFVECSDGRLYHPVIAEKALESWDRKQAQRERTVAARKARLSQRQSQNAASPVTTSATTSATTSVTGSKGREGIGKGIGKGNGRDLSDPSAKASGSAKPTDPVRDELWATGIAILTGKGMGRDPAAVFLGKLAKDYGQLLALEAIRDCVRTQPAEPKSWLVARCQERRAQAGSKQLALEARNRAVAENWAPPEDVDAA